MTYTPQPPWQNIPTDYTLSGTGDFIASIPGLLGYFPQESAIVVTLELDEHAGAACIGQVLRTDVGDAEQVAAMASMAPAGPALAHLGLVVSRIPDSMLVRDAVKALYTATDIRGKAVVDACWHVSEIAAGTPYCLLFGPAASEIAQAGLSRDLLSGTVSSIITQPTMEPLIAQGALPELDKDDTRSFFDCFKPGEGRATHPEATRARRRGKRLVQQLAVTPDTVRAEVSRACAVLVQAPELPFVGSGKRARPAEVVGNAVDLETVVAVLSQPLLRDCLFQTAICNPRSAASVLLAIARSFDGEIRANALSLWGVIAVRLRLTSWAQAAIDAAQEAMPEHSLSDILHQLLRMGAHEKILDSALAGCDEVWGDLAV